MVSITPYVHNIYENSQYSLDYPLFHTSMLGMEAGGLAGWWTCELVDWLAGGLVSWWTGWLVDLSAGDYLAGGCVTWWTD